MHRIAAHTVAPSDQMLVVAFDGVLFDTLSLRATAIAESLVTEGVTVTHELVASIVASRSIAETIRMCLQKWQPTESSTIDETLLDLVTLKASRAVSDLTARGASLHVTVRDKLRRAASVTRIVVRADSRRREVEQLLIMAELDSIVSFVRCSDDGSPPSEHVAGASTLERSYAHIVRRMAGNANLLGEASSIGIALEASEQGRIAARALGFEAPENFSSALLPGAP
ncbi:MAG: hypothetical protein ABI852_10765 [Gemmatimonadaceae bacterium]